MNIRVQQIEFNFVRKKISKNQKVMRKDSHSWGDEADVHARKGRECKDWHSINGLVLWRRAISRINVPAPALKIRTPDRNS
jgi:hypothetical protein